MSFGKKKSVAKQPVATETAVESTARPNERIRRGNSYDQEDAGANPGSALLPGGNETDDAQRRGRGRGRSSMLS